MLLVITCSADAPARGAEPLRYRWQPGEPFAYEIEITVDTPDSLETYKGRLVYTRAAADGDLIKLSCSGGLTNSDKSKSGASTSSRSFGPHSIGGPFSHSSRDPYPGLAQTTSTLTMNPQGLVQSHEGNSQLPWLLGNLSLLILEQFPDGDEPSWTEESGVLVTSKVREESIRFRSLHSRLESTSAEREKYAAGSISCAFKIAQSQGDLAGIDKQFRMKLGDEATLDIVGSGQWTFHRTLGVPEKLDFQQKMTISTDNVSVNFPITIKCQRFSEEAWKQIQEKERLKREEAARAAAEARAKAEKRARIEAAIPLTPEQKKSLIADLKSDDFWRIKQALEKLAAKNVTDDDKQLVAAIVPATKQENVFVRRDAQTVDRWHWIIAAGAAADSHGIAGHPGWGPA